MSVVIPVLNRPEKVLRAIGSATAALTACRLEQESEIIVVDDASDPPLVLLPSQSGVAIRLLTNASNLGPGPSRTRGVEAARGTYVAFLDSDDAWLPSRISSMLDFIGNWEARQGRDAIAVYASGYITVRPDGTPRNACIPLTSEEFLWFAGGCWFCPGSTAIMRKDVWQHIGPYDPVCRRLEDFDWYLRFANAGGRMHVNGCLDVLVERGERRPSAPVLASAAHVLKKYTRTSAEREEMLDHLSSYLDLECAVAHFGQGQLWRAANLLLRSWYSHPRLRFHSQRYWSHQDLARCPQAAIQICAKWQDWTLMRESQSGDQGWSRLRRVVANTIPPMGKTITNCRSDAHRSSAQAVRARGKTDTDN